MHKKSNNYFQYPLWHDAEAAQNNTMMLFSKKAQFKNMTQSMTQKQNLKRWPKAQLEGLPKSTIQKLFVEFLVNFWDFALHFVNTEKGGFCN